MDEDPNNPVWSRYIGLLVDREPTHCCLGDASYGGLGAWSPASDFNFMFRLTRDDLIRAGFDMKAINDDTCEPDGASDDGLHINVLEFVVIIIQLWFVLKFIQQSGPRLGGYIVTLIGDNTSALSWLRYAARSHRPAVRELSRFALALTLACSFDMKLSGRHLAGSLNTGADALSRPQEFPMWDCAIKQHSPLAHCQAYRVPFELLSVLAEIISSAKTGVAYEPPTTELLTLALSTLSTGSGNSSSQSSLSRNSHRSKRSR